MKYLKAAALWLLVVVFMFSIFAVFTTTFDIRRWDEGVRLGLAIMYGFSIVAPILYLINADDH